MPETTPTPHVLCGSSSQVTASAVAPCPQALPYELPDHSDDPPYDHNRQDWRRLPAAFSSSVQALESTPRPPPDLYRSFRHSSWSRQRHAVWNQLGRFQGGFDVRPPGRAFTSAPNQRFAECGSYASIVISDDDPPIYAVHARTCKQRFCLPCQQDRGRLIAANLREKLPNVRIRFLTLTIRAKDLPLADALDHLYTSFIRLRRSKVWRAHVEGGLAILEIGWRPEHDRWHPHLHVLFQGKYFPHEALRLAWHRITTDSYIIHIKPAGSTDALADYLAKYLTKSMAAGVWSRPDRLRECMVATHGRKFLFSFGSWSRLRLLEPPEDPHSWNWLCSAADLLQDARDGDPVALSIATALWRQHFVTWNEREQPCTRSPPTSSHPTPLAIPSLSDHS